MSSTIICKNCGVEIPDEERIPHPTSRTGFSNLCASCRSAARRQWHRTGVKHTPNAGYVYLLGCDYGIYKLGITANLANRVEHIQNNSPVPITVICSAFVQDASTMEARLAATVQARHSHGEWYKLDASDLHTLKQLFRQLTSN